MRVVTAFCLACVCTELLVQLVEAGWSKSRTNRDF